MLESFDIAHNKLIELPGLTCLSRITNFNASHNCLESIPHEISFLRSVTCLELSHNSISIIPDSIQDLHNLERLYLQHNKLKAMPVLKNCQHLKVNNTYANVSLRHFWVVFFRGRMAKSNVLHILSIAIKNHVGNNIFLKNFLY